MNIIIKKHFLLYKGYKLKCSIGKSGITHVKKEGDLATPKGVFKLGLLYYRKDRNKSLKSKLLLQVHDELVFDVHLAELDIVKQIVLKNMENAIQIDVPLKVDIGNGDNWLVAH